MENYRLLQRLGKGAQGSVYLAANKIDSEQYVLKKVECNDESEANKAFKEAMALAELQHPYVCGYKEFFVTWDKETLDSTARVASAKESAMFVCIVMDYYKHGDLGMVLRKKRDDKENIDELVIKKWIGQIIEALIFVHKKKVIHRDLKPSNIFMTEDLSICIGDFGVATIMGDARTKTRTTVGSMNWMAPEVLERPYDERSDVWSVGCIALELATCGSCDVTQMSGKLFEIKHNQQSLEDMLEAVSKNYSAELVSVIRTMLRRNFKQRPSAQELVDIPYIKECLALSGSVLAQRKKRQQSAPAGGPMPRNRGVDPVVDYLGANLGNENCVREALEYLSQLSKEEGCNLDNSSKSIILRAMNDYVAEREIQVAGCNTLNNLVVGATIGDFLYSPEVIQSITLAMKSHASSADLQQAATSLLMALSADEGAAELIGNNGGLQDILAAMRTFPNNCELCVVCCTAIWSLTVNEDNARIVSEEKGLQDVVSAFNTHFNSPELIESACAALLSLAIEDGNIESMNEMECVGLLLHALEKHVKEPKVVKNACMALASMVEPDEESAYKLLSNSRDDKEVRGIPIVIQAYEQHKDNAEVVESICTLIMELAEYDEINAEIKYLKIGETVLNEVHKRFKDNMDIMSPCEAALKKLGSNKMTSRPLSASRNKNKDRK